MPASEFSDVFISYRRKDVEFVKPFVEALQAKGKEVWVDWEDIPPGSVGFSDDIKRGIEGADAFLCVLSPDYLESTYCVDMELAYAVELNKKMIPVVLSKFEGQDVPNGIGHINWIYFTPHAGQENTFEESFPRVIEALESDQEHVRGHKRFLLRAIEWDESGRQNSYLLDGAEIQVAEDWLSSAIGKDPAPSNLHKDFINFSRAHESRRQRTIMTGIIIALVVSILLTILSGFLGFQAERSSNNAETQAALALRSAYTATVAQGQAELAADNAMTQEALALRSAYTATVAQGQAELAADNAMTQEALARISAITATVAQGQAEIQSDLADQARDQAEALAREVQSVFLANAGSEALEDGDPFLALTLVQAAMDHDVPPQQEVISTYASVAYEPGPRRAIAGNSGGVVRIAVSPDESLVLVARCLDDYRNCQQDDLSLFDTASWDKIRSYSGHAGVASQIAFNSDATQAATAACIEKQDELCINSEIIIWDIMTGAIIRQWQAHDSIITSIAFSADGTQLLSAGFDLVLWDLRTGNETYRLNPTVGGIVAADFVGDGATILALGCSQLCDSTHLVEVDATTGDSLRQEDDIANPENQTIAIHPDGKLALFGGFEGQAILWDIENWRIHQELREHPGGISLARFNSDGSMVIGANLQRDFAVWDFDRSEFNQYSAGSMNIIDVALINDGLQAIVASRLPPTPLVVWDLQNGAIVSKFSPYIESVTQVAFSPDGDSIFTTAYYPEIGVFDANSGAVQDGWYTDRAISADLTVSPDGQYIAVGSCAEEDESLFCLKGSLQIWDAAGGELIKDLLIHDNWIVHVAFSPDSSLVATASDDGTVRIVDWESETTLQTFTFEQPDIAGITFIQDGSAVAIATNRQLAAWDVQTGEMIAHFEDSEIEALISDLTVDETTQRLALAHANGFVSIWDMISGEMVNQIFVSIQRIETIALHQDRLYAAVDREIAVLDLESASQLWSLDPETMVTSLDVKPDGSELVSGTWNGIMLWRLDDPREIVGWGRQNRYIRDLSCDVSVSFRLYDSEEECEQETD